MLQKIINNNSHYFRGFIKVGNRQTNAERNKQADKHKVDIDENIVPHDAAVVMAHFYGISSSQG